MCERGRFDTSQILIATAKASYDLLDAASRQLTTTPAFLADLYTVQLFYHNEVTSDISMVDLARRALDVREAAVGQGQMDEYDPNRANGFMNVGVVMTQDDPRGAIEMHTKALEIRLGSDKYRHQQLHGLALNYLNIGRCWFLVGDLDQAATCFEKCLTIMRAREKEVGKRFALYVLCVDLLSPPCLPVPIAWS